MLSGVWWWAGTIMMELRGWARFWGRILAEVVTKINLASFGPFVAVLGKPESTLTDMKTKQRCIPESVVSALLEKKENGLRHAETCSQVRPCRGPTSISNTLNFPSPLYLMVLICLPRSRLA
ncbi:hypothetical protein RchiOBHm_Chr4g0443421 [Rosa chinensis]|uniref:Uncharacterized protein n=1 Tax=Rosa chinensis TaxID=74649 RepID=A0A2P6R3U3_ROSCH|nr:hypothetical protein RchiOBHm_Chr4g0443421 [Rosa chinensis]